MGQGVAWAAKELGVPCTVVVPDYAPETKVSAMERLGADVVKKPFDEWWEALEESRMEGVDGLFLHPVENEQVMAGNGTIGLEILEDLPDPDLVLIPFGGGGLTVRDRQRDQGGAPRDEGLLRRAGHGGAAERDPRGRLDADDRLPGVVRRRRGRQGAAAEDVGPRRAPDRRRSSGLARRGRRPRSGSSPSASRVIAEGAGALAPAAALSGRAGEGKIVCIVSGGNIDFPVLSRILAGETP